MPHLSSLFIIFLAKDFIFLVLVAAVWFFFALPSSERKNFLVFALITLPLAYVIAKLLSLVYYDPRPFVASHLVPLLPHAADNGFPSDHTLILAAVAAVIFCFRKKAGLIFFIAAVIVGIARVLAGVHHPVDILGSLVISAAVAYFVWKIIFLRLKKIWL